MLMDSEEEFFLKKCPGCDQDMKLKKKSFDLFKQISDEFYEQIINSQICSVECASKFFSKKKH